jgi:hypothetical protein
MASVVDLKVGDKPQRTDRIYCEKMNVHVRLCRMTACQFYEQCGAKLSQIQAKHKYGRLI